MDDVATTSPGPDPGAPDEQPTTMFEPRRGDSLAGFVIDYAVGEGGLAHVYAATHPTRSGRFAIKIAKSTAKTNVKKRFTREAKILHELRHPNVVPALVSGVTPDGRGFLVMPLVEGRTLTQCVRDDGPMDPVEVRRIVVDVLSGLAAAHAAKLVHRDLKPSNLLRSDDGEIAIVDFGIARAYDGEQMRTCLTDGGLIGTPSFMAPEQIMASSEVSPAADVYGLGATICFLLRGTPPFVGALPDVIESHLSKDPPDLTAYGDLGVLAMQMLMKAPEKRPTVAALLDRLAPDADRPTAERTALLVPPHSSDSDTPRWWTFGLVLSALLFISAITAGVTILMNEPELAAPTTINVIRAPSVDPIKIPSVVPRDHPPPEPDVLPVVDETPEPERPEPIRRRRPRNVPKPIVEPPPATVVQIDQAELDRRLGATWALMKRLDRNLPDATFVSLEKRYLGLKERTASATDAGGRAKLAVEIRRLSRDLEKHLPKE